jgi:hypothetical protein
MQLSEWRRPELSLLSELINSLTDSSRPLADMLRTAKVLASRLSSPGLAEWVTNELGGYKTVDSLPPYRRLPMLTYGDFSGPFGSFVNNSAIPYMGFPQKYQEQARVYLEMHGVASIESQVAAGEDLNLEWDPNLTLILRDSVQMSGGMVLTRLHSSVPRTELVGVLDEVRNRLLGLVLDIEKENPMAGSTGETSMEPSPERVQQIINNNIYSSGGNFAIGSHDFQQNNYTINEGDTDALFKALLELGVSKAEFDDLQDAISEDNGGLGEKVSGWIGKMVSKAFDGGLKIAGGAAGQVIGTLIAGYLGISL